MHRFFFWWNRGEPEQPPQARIEWSNEPPAPIDNPVWQSSREPQQGMPADIQAQMHRAAAEAWRNWRPEPLAQTRHYGATIADIIPLAIVREGHEAGRKIAAEQRAHSILIVDDLPLMGNPFAPEYSPWHPNAVTAIYDAYEALPPAQKQWLRRLCTITPGRVGMHIAIWYPSRAAKWRGARVTQVLPALAGLAVNTLRPLCQLPFECVAEIDPHLTPFVASAGYLGWRLEIYETDAPDELGRAAA